MSDILSRFNSGKLWDFPGGIHPLEMKSQSNQTPIHQLPLPQDFYIPVKQHAGKAGELLVKVGDKVLKGQPLTQGDNLRTLPVHAPTSGRIVAIAPYVAAHPSGLSELSIHLQADGLDQWREQQPLEDFLQQSPEQLIEKIYQAGVAGLGGAVFPTAAKVQAADKQCKLLIINGAECEPYITCDDRLMQDYPAEIIEGVRILRYILRPEKVVIAVEDNKPEAIQALQQALHGANDIEVRVIPTKYPSGAAKQLIQVLTGMEVPKGKHSSAIGVLMQNVGTAFAVKRAVIDDEPLIERVVTLTGDKVQNKGNVWARFGTPILHLLQHSGYQYDERLPVFMGGPMMGFTLPNLNAPLTKVSNCLLAPDHFEYAPPPEERSCIRCSACSDACPLQLMPQQLYWFARSEDHEKSEEYSLFDCIECGVCAFVCPSHIPLIQYFRQEKAKIWDIQAKAKQAEEAKQRFEARQARLEKEEQARKARAQKAAANRRQELSEQQGEDPVKAALERLKAKKAAEATASAPEKTLVDEKGELQPDNSDLMAQRKARRLARQANELDSPPSGLRPAPPASRGSNESATALLEPETPEIDPRKAAVAAAIARAKAKKAQQAGEAGSPPSGLRPAPSAGRGSEDPANEEKTLEKTTALSEPETQEVDPRKAAVAAAIARAKAKKAQQAGETGSLPSGLRPAPPAGRGSEDPANEEKTLEKTTALSEPETPEIDPRKAAVAAAIARAKAKKAQQAGSPPSGLRPAPPAGRGSEDPANEEKTSEKTTALSEPETQEVDPRKTAVAAAIARAKAKKAAQLAEKNISDNHLANKAGEDV